MKKIGCLLLLPFLGIVFFVLLFSGTGDIDNSGEISITTEEEKNAQIIYDFVLKNGGTKEFACAWIGNAESESGLRADRIQGDFAFNEDWVYDVDVVGYALGLFQYDGGRRVALLQKAKKENKEWKDPLFQVEFAWEFDGSDSTLLQSFSKSTDLKQTTLDILKRWERAGTQNDPIEQNVRISRASNWLAFFSISGKIEALEPLKGKKIYNGECYGLTSYYVDSFNTKIHMGAGSPHGLSENIGDTVNAWNIGEAYKWAENGFDVIQNPTFSQLKAGYILNVKQGGVASAKEGHTMIVCGIGEDGLFKTYEQNVSGMGAVNLYMRKWGVDFPNVVSIVRRR